MRDGHPILTRFNSEPFLFIQIKAFIASRHDLKKRFLNDLLLSLKVNLFIISQNYEIISVKFKSVNKLIHGIKHTLNKSINLNYIECHWQLHLYQNITISYRQTKLDKYSLNFIPK